MVMEHTVSLSYFIVLILICIYFCTKAFSRLKQANEALSKADQAYIDAKRALREAAEKEQIVNESKQNYPWLAELIASWSAANDEQLAQAMIYKKRPAIESARKVREIAKEKRILVKQCRQYESQLNYYETVFPWLEEFKEIDPKEAYEYTRSTESDSEYEAIHNYLSPEEYRELPTSERYQRALDRYMVRKKNNWEAGIEYERYIGYIFEQDGYTVKYVGALFGLEDMGRDLIATKNDRTYIIQCKRWTIDKTIHEKHVFQLYGSVVHWNIEHPSNKATGILVTTAKLSPLARQCAEYLEIMSREEYPMPSSYPMIKCHVGKTEKIYHLPFDQQYDRTQMSRDDGDIYVSTVAEAEKLGFRRAYRWKGSSS